jgi:hypothetical protein
LNTRHLKGYFLGESLLVWHQAADTLSLIEGIGIWAFLGLDQGLNKSCLLMEYQTQYSGQSIQHIEQVIQSLAHFFSDTGQVPAVAYIEEFSYIRRQRLYADNPAKDICFCINGIYYQLLSDNRDVVEQVQHLLAHFFHPPPNTTDYQFVVEKTCQDSDHLTSRIICNGIVLKEGVLAEHLLPILIDYIQISNYQSIDYLIAVHAAVVAKGRQVFVFPGVSGSGKTSLCLHLVTKGFICYSDELAILNKNFSFQTLCLPVSIKSGAWQLFDSAWPALAEARVWQKENGTDLKYLPLPSDGCLPVDSNTAKKTIVFPRYDPEAIFPECSRLSPTQSLINIIQAGYQIKHGLSQNKVSDLICFFNKTPAFTMSYRHFDDIDYFYESDSQIYS